MPVNALSRLTNPASQHRYGYVEGNPATVTDHLGFSVLDDYAYSKKMAGSSKAGKGVGKASPKSKYVDQCVGSPCSSSRLSDRHLPFFGTGPTLNAIGGDPSAQCLLDSPGNIPTCILGGGLCRSAVDGYGNLSVGNLNSSVAVFAIPNDVTPVTPVVPAGPALAATGLDATPATIAALGLVAAGVIALVVARRRRTTAAKN